MFVFSLYIFYIHDTPHACQAYLQMFRAWAREYLAQGLCVKLCHHTFTCSFVCCCYAEASKLWRSKLPCLHIVKHQLPSQFLEKDPTEVNRQRVLFRSILTTIMILTAAAAMRAHKGHRRFCVT